MAAPGIYTNTEPGRQASVPNIYTPVTARGKNTKQVKAEVPFISEKNIGEDNKNQSKATNRRKHAYEETVIGKETAAGLYGTAAGIYTDLQPVTAEPRYLHVGDHVVVYSGQESGDAYGYREAEEVNKGFEGDHYYRDYEKPEEVDGGYKEPDVVHTYKGLEENHYSHDYDKPEDVHDYKDPVKESFAFRAKDLNECAKTPCRHGRCVNQDGGYKCICSVGWTGQNCQQDMDKCNKKPCQHGRCVNKDGGYKCTCSPGWTGQNCQQDIDECKENPCHHGRCVNRGDGYKCTCSPGWTGHNCDQDIDECNKNPCQHGRCVNKDGGYDCTCSPGWTGQNCQQALRCQAEWSKYNNHCYKLMTDKVCWFIAKAGCEKHGANLASIKDVGENNFITGLIKNGG
ncbi:hypothetical protein Bbelb_281830 [Branchiostoma belcheri]|nr:hypothetical protein Bbelb_281830 [Branchiostoma belcheri]